MLIYLTVLFWLMTASKCFTEVHIMSFSNMFTFQDNLTNKFHRRVITLLRNNALWAQSYKELFSINLHYADFLAFW